jgi:hypothetical protein
MMNSTQRQFGFLAVVIFSTIAMHCGIEPSPQPEQPATALQINEFMTSNPPDSSGGIVDESGDADDWIELYNTADTAVPLGGLFLTDDSTQLAKFALHDTAIGPQAHYLLWADEQGQQGTNHANFKLSAVEGEELILSDGQSTIFDRIQFFATSPNPEARLPDVAYGRSADGASTWCRQQTPTPGGSNSGCQ